MVNACSVSAIPASSVHYIRHCFYSLKSNIREKTIEPACRPRSRFWFDVEILRAARRKRWERLGETAELADIQQHRTLETGIYDQRLLH